MNYRLYSREPNPDCVDTNVAEYGFGDSPPWRTICYGEVEAASKRAAWAEFRKRFPGAKSGRFCYILSKDEDPRP